MIRLMERYAVSIAVLLIVFVSSAYALGCRRCGRASCHGCNYYAPTYYKPYVAPVVAAPDTNVYVVQSNYPAPLVGQGQSPYYSAGAQGFQAAALPLFDPNQYFSQEIQLHRAAEQTNALRFERTQALVQRITELQAPAVERMAAGQAASMVLTAAGLNPTAQASGGQQQAVVIDRDERGSIRVQPLTTTQVEAIRLKVQTGPGQPLPPAPPVQPPNDPPPGPPQPVGGSLTMTYCAKCHGLDVASPKKGLYLGDDPNVAKAMKAKWFEITTAVGNGSMPPADSPQPTREERAAILDELQSFITKQDSSGVER